MVRYLVFACGLALLQSTVHADDIGNQVVKSPCVIHVDEIDKASNSLVLLQGESHIESLTLWITVNTANTGTQTFNLPRWRYFDIPKQVAFSLKNTKIYDSTGTQISQSEALKRAKPGMAVVIARQGDKIGLEYLFVFKKDTLIIVVPTTQQIPKPITPRRSFLMLLLETIGIVSPEELFCPSF